MGRNDHSAGKRQREAEKARKKRDKAERKRRNRLSGGEGIPIASVEEVQVAAMAPPVAMPPDGTPRRGRTSGQPCRLFIGKLSWDTTTEELKAFFATCGEVVDAVVVLDRDTGDSRGFGFVTMADKKVAAVAIRDLDGKELDGRNIRVSIATERPR